MPEKIGVYIDESSLMSLFDGSDLVEFVKNKFGDLCPVVKSYPRLAKDSVVKEIQADIDNGTIDAVCIAGPTPRVDSDVFCFGKTPTERVNLREQAIKGYSNPDGTALAKGDKAPAELVAIVHDYLKMGVVKLTKIRPINPEIPEMFKTIMVLGGGWTGLHAAKYAASIGHDVVIIEKLDKIGGKAIGQYKTFPMKAPYTEAQFSGIEALVEEVTNNPKITVLTDSSLEKLDGAPGLYKAEVKTAGGAKTLEIGAVVLATGWDPLNSKYYAPLGLSDIQDVITSAEFEAMVKANNMVRPSDGKVIETVAFVTDVEKCIVPEGEGAETEAAAEEGEEEGFVFKDMENCKHLAYSSELSSLVALKHANYVREKNEDNGMAYIFYDHMMVPGINELYYKAAQDDPGVMLTKGTISNIKKAETGGVVVTAKDTLLGEDIELDVDLVVLPTGLVPTTAHSPILGLQYRQGPAFPDLDLFDGFADSNYICFPYETRRTGIYAAGCVRQPMTMALAADDAAGAALKASQCINSASHGVAVHPRSGDLTYPVFNFVRCTQCKRCTEECPFGALDDDPKGTPMPNPTRCRRCGTCMGACPERVISFDNYNIDMVGNMIREIDVPASFDQGGPRVLILACENDAYPCLDMAALRGRHWSPYVRVIPVRCLGSVNAIWVADAMSKGIDGVMMLGCKYGDDYQCHFVKGSELCNRRKENIAESLKRLGVEPDRVEQYEVAIDDYDKVPGLIEEFMNMIFEKGPNPFKGY